MPNTADVTQLLNHIGDDKNAVSKAIAPIVFSELHRLAKRYMQNEKAGHTLQATCLVNEAFINLVDKDVSWQNRDHFFAIAAKQMRRILVDHARQKMTQKRGDNAVSSTYTESLFAQNVDPSEELVLIDQLLDRLAKKDQQNAEIFELKYFAGLTLSEIALLKGLSLSTVEREMRFSKAWLAKQLGMK
ncbi:MAG: sigma-70 family RNA polymerase sigma factor [Aliiglaciecola sp.]